MSRTRFRVNPHSSERSFGLIQILGIIWQEKKEKFTVSFHVYIHIGTGFILAKHLEKM